MESVSWNDVGSFLPVRYFIFVVMWRPCRWTVFNKRSDQRLIKWKQNIRRLVGNGFFYHTQHSISFTVCHLTMAGWLQIVCDFDTQIFPFFARDHSVLHTETADYRYRCAGLYTWVYWNPFAISWTNHPMTWRLKQPLSLQTDWKIFMLLFATYLCVLLFLPACVNSQITYNLRHVQYKHEIADSSFCQGFLAFS